MIDDAAISGYEVYFHLINEAEYCEEITSFARLFEVNRAIFNRQCFPYTPSYYMKGFKQYISKKKENYRGSDVKCSPLAKFSKKCLVGHNSEVRSGCDVRYSTIGDNCLLGEYSFISNSIVMHGAKIGKNRHIRDTIIGPNAIILDNTKVPPHSIIEESSSGDK